MKCWVFALLIGVVWAAPGGKHHIQERSVGKMLDQLVIEAGVHELLPWAQDKIKNDPATQKIIEFFKSDRWDNIKEHLKTCPEYVAIKDDLLKEDIDLVKILEDVKDFVVGGKGRSFQARSGLSDILDEFFGKLDLEAVAAIIQTKLKGGDKDMKKVYDFVHGQQLKDIVKCMKQNTDVQDLLDELLEDGVNVKKLTDMLKALLFPLTRQTRSAVDSVDARFDLQGLFDIIQTVVNAIKNLLSSSRSIGHEDTRFISSIIETIKNLIEKIKNLFQSSSVSNEEARFISLQGLFELVQKLVDAVKNLLSSSRSVSQEDARGLQDLINLIQKVIETIKNIFASSSVSRQDARFDLQSIFDIIQTVVSAIKNLLSSSRSIGHEDTRFISGIIETIKNLIEKIKNLFQSSSVSNEEARFISLQSLFQLVQKLVDAVKNLLSSRSVSQEDARGLQSLIDFVQNLIEKIKNLFGSSRTVDFVDARFNLQSIFELIQTVVSAIKNLLSSSRSIGHEDTRFISGIIETIKNLIEKIKNLFQSSSVSNEEARFISLQSLFQLVQKLVDAVKNLLSSRSVSQEDARGLQSLIDFVQNLIEKIKNLFGSSRTVDFVDARFNLQSIFELIQTVVSAIKNLLSSSRSIGHEDTRFISGIIETIKNLIEKIKNLFQSSSVSNEEARFISLQSLFQLVQKLVDAVKNLLSSRSVSQEDTRFLQNLINLVQKVIETIKNLFPSSRALIHHEARSVHSLLQELIKESGLQDLLPWFQQMIRNDPDLQRVVDYFRGEKWANLKNQVQNCGSYQAIKDKLLGEGIDIIQILDDVKNFVVGDQRSTSRKSLGDLLEEILGQLDLDKLIVLIYDKLDHDEDMKTLVNFFEGDDMKAIADCMRGSPEVQDLLQELKEQGIDLVRIVELLKLLFASDYYLSLPVGGY